MYLFYLKDPNRNLRMLFATVGNNWALFPHYSSRTNVSLLFFLQASGFALVMIGFVWLTYIESQEPHEKVDGASTAAATQDSNTSGGSSNVCTKFKNCRKGRGGEYGSLDGR